MVQSKENKETKIIKKIKNVNIVKEVKKETVKKEPKKELIKKTVKSEPKKESKKGLKKEPKKESEKEIKELTNLQNILPTNPSSKLQTTITKKGYEIEKKDLGEELESLKKELTVEPYIPGEENVKKFPVFSETKTKIIIPRFYGIKKYGLPSSNQLLCVDSNYKFLGSLRENQTKILDKTIPHLNKHYGGILSVSCASGKCLAKRTKILMYDGSLKNVEDVIIGDLLMGDDSTPRKVMSLARGKEEMFDIIQFKEEKYTVNKSHILSLKWTANSPITIKGKTFSKDCIVDISVEDYNGLLKSNKNMISSLKGYRVPIDFQNKQIQFDPYLLGYLVGNHYSNIYQIPIHNKQILNDISQKLKIYDVRLEYSGNICRSQHKLLYNIVPISKKSNKFNDLMKQLNLLNNKHIPLHYKCNSKDIRLAVLAGLIDSHDNMSIDDTGYKFNTNSLTLVNDIVYLCRSLGFSCYSVKRQHNNNYDVYVNNTVYTDEIPVLHQDNKIRYMNQNTDLTYEISVKSVGNDEYYGFEIDGNRRFVLGDFTVTHNTVMALYLGAYLKAKMMVLVHKSFLLTQWVDRAKQFTNAKIGILQREKIPDHDCDIVIGMIQSISLKQYDDKIFEGFKLLVVDECFVFDQLILTDNGPIRIGTLYNNWKNNKKLPLIKSFNEITKEFEYKKLTYAWEKRITDNLYKITLGDKIIICTGNHKILTVNGYIEAHKLTQDMHIISNSVRINDDQLQIVIGSFLGKGNILNRNGKYILKVQYECKQKEYYEWKALMFSSKVDITENNKKNSFETELVGIDYDFPKTKTTCPQWLIDKIDYRGIAIWFMDCAFMNKNKKSFIFSTYSFDEDSQKRLVKKLNELGIECEYLKSKYFYIKTTKKGTNKIIKLNDYFKQYKWNNQYLDYGYIKISDIEKIKITKDNEYVYDIEVEDNHNFVVCGSDTNSTTGIVAHNCHHYACPVFSKGLQKCGAPYVFALSATPFRPDKLTKVLFWNLGNIYYRQKAKVNKQVICKVFRFKSKDKLFIEKKQWRNGEMKPSHTKMINNFVQIKDRNTQIINILNELRKYPERKVLVLSGRKEHLKLLKDSIDKKIGDDIESGLLEPMEYRTYYYVGGMKPAQRKDAEDYGDMFFGTYDMAHEGLDIDRLNTVILATSKKNIVQSVGRVMRRILKVGDLRPLIIDIRDEISIYKNQGEQRLKQYKKGKYKIENYYIHDQQILSLQDHLKDEYNMTKQEIAEYEKEHPEEIYIPKLENILDLQKVQEEDEKMNEQAEIIELDPNDECLDEDSEEENNESDDDSDDDDDGGKFKKPSYDDYLF